MRHKRVFLALFIVALFIIVPTVHASDLLENYCFPVYTPDRCISLMQWVENWVNRSLAGLAIWGLKGLAQVAWLLDRVAAFIYNKSVLDNVWLINIKNHMATLFANMMPGLLRSVAFGSGGLMYIALAIAGLLMMIPLWGAGARFARPERVLVWGALLSVLFVSGTFGYDFIFQVETYRQNIVSGIVQGSAMPLDNLIQQPMLAGSGDLGFGSNLMALPPVFDSTYFPEPSLMEVTISEGGGFGFGNALVEPEFNILNRLVLAQQGAFYAVVSLFGAWLLILTGITYALLAFTALILIVFILAALPLGFFEVGGQILTDLAGRYFQIVIISLTLAVFLRWMSGGLGYIVDVNSVTNSIIWIIVVVITIIVTGTFMKGSLGLLLQSPKLVQRTLNAFSAPFAVDFAAAARNTGELVDNVRNFVGGVGGVAGAARDVLPILLAGSHPAAAVAAGMLMNANRAGQERGNVFISNGIVPSGAAVGQASGAGTTAGVGAGTTASVGTGATAGVGAGTTVGAGTGATAGVGAGTTVGAGTGATAGIGAGTTVGVDAGKMDYNARVLRSQTVLQTISARQHWDDVNMKQLMEVVKSSKDVNEAVALLQRSPGFERSSSDELRMAVEAARNIAI